jgi:lysophospholipase L1-like esterase
VTDFERYVAIGDSTTEGLFDPDGNGGNRGWADRLAEHLAAHQGAIYYANLAVRGRRTQEIHDEQLGPALELEPDLVSVVAGMNDLLRPSFDIDLVMSHMNAMFAALAQTGATVLTFTFGDPVPVNPYARVLRRRLNALNARVRTSAAGHGAVLVDFAREPIVSDSRFWCEDRLHANTEGHRRIAAASAEALGVRLEGPRWNEPLPAAPRRKRREFIAGEIGWAREYLAPWVGRRFRNVSSGDGVEPKRPHLTRLGRP